MEGRGKGGRRNEGRREGGRVGGRVGGREGRKDEEPSSFRPSHPPSLPPSFVPPSPFPPSLHPSSTHQSPNPQFIPTPLRPFALPSRRSLSPSTPSLLHSFTSLFLALSVSLSAHLVIYRPSPLPMPSFPSLSPKPFNPSFPSLSHPPSPCPFVLILLGHCVPVPCSSYPHSPCSLFPRVSIPPISEFSFLSPFDKIPWELTSFRP